MCLMDKQHDEALTLWLALLKHPSEPGGEELARIPDPVRHALIEQGLAHLHAGRLEITFEGIKHLRALPVTREQPSG